MEDEDGDSEILDDISGPNTLKYNCNSCNYHTNKIYEWRRHLHTQKHASFTNTSFIKMSTESACRCGKIFKSRSGLHKHRRKCSEKDKLMCHANSIVPLPTHGGAQSLMSFSLVETATPSKYGIASLNNDGFAEEGQYTEKQIIGYEKYKMSMPVDLNEIITKDFILNIIQQNQELKNLLMEEREMRREDSEELKSMIEELAKHPNVVNNSNTTTNNQFNLNIFLNEKCKDAISLTQFVDSLEVGPHNVEYTGVHGYVAGISKIFTDGLKQLDVYNRPIHCTDLKREILYIKEDNVWEKDNPEKSKFKKALNAVVRKNIQQVSAWVSENPRCEILDTSEYQLHLNIMRQCIGGDISQEDANNRKILRNVAKQVMIDRSIM